MKLKEDKRRISVLGTGDFACALSKRLLENGYKVMIGSRAPSSRDLTQRDPIFSKAKVTSVQKAITGSNIVVVAIPCHAYSALQVYKEEAAEKIIVDVSNPNKRSKGASNAENLASILSKSTVVKGFNTISAYALGSDVANEHREVFVAGNSPPAVEEVCQVARDMGFGVHNAGRLQKARELEAQPLYLFRGWGWPTTFTFVLFIIEILYLIVVMYILVDRYDTSQIPTYMMYKAFGAMGVNLLAFCYLPGILAAFAQIYYGTKHKRFQVWLDKWLLGRKQLGIYALLFSFMHMITVMSCMNGAYFSYLFKKQYVTIEVNATEDYKIPVDTKMNLHGEGCIISGLVALCTMGILGLTSIPPVGAMMNWREWRFIQSQFGFLVFILTVGHCMVHGVARWMVQRDLPLRNSFMSLLIPWLTLVLKAIYFIPCVNNYVWKVREGYERGAQYDAETGLGSESSSQSDSRSGSQGAVSQTSWGENSGFSEESSDSGVAVKTAGKDSSMVSSQL